MSSVMSGEGHSDNNIFVYYQNTRSIKNCTADIFNNLTHFEFDIVALTETWLDSTVSDAEVCPDSFYLFRSDRNFATVNRARGGGVLLAIRNNLFCEQLNINLANVNVSPLIDVVGVKVRSERNSLCILLVYVPPGLSAEECKRFFEYLSSMEFVYGSDTLLLGDFNVSGYADYLRNGRQDNYVRILTDFMNLLGLNQYNLVENANSRLLDLVLFGRQCTVRESDVLLTRADDHHPPLSVSFVYNESIGLNRGIPKNKSNMYNFRKANFPVLYGMLLDVDWTFLDDIGDVDECCKTFYDRIYAIFDECIPKFGLSNRRVFPPWFHNEIKRNIRLKSISWRKYKVTGDRSDYENFSRLRHQIKADVDVSYREYMRLIENGVTNDPNKFWAFVGSRKGSAGVGRGMQYENSTFTTVDGIVNAFANFFSHSYHAPSGLPEGLPFTVPPHAFPSAAINIANFSETEVFNAIRQIRPKLTAGPDDIPAFIVRDCAGVFAHPLSVIFNKCLSVSKMPSVWKCSKVCPVYKKGNRLDISNFRPISLIPNFSKVFEILLHEIIYYRVKNLITPLQHGFFKGRSTVTNLACITEFLAEGIDRRRQADVVYMDLSKAFDRLDHNILLRKLYNFGFSDNLILFFKSYLMNRNQFVTYGGVRSIGYLAPSGVPQGSVLGPLLFTLFINDIVENLTVRCLLYADDLKLFSIISSRDDCRLLQQNLDLVNDWCIENRLDLNISKCNVMSFTSKATTLEFDYGINGNTLARPNVFQDLGVVFDKQMSFVPHINLLVSDAFRILGFVLRTTRNFQSIVPLKKLFSAFVLSKLEYASIIWGPYYGVHAEHIESVQRRFAKALWFRTDGIYPSVGFPHDQLLNRFSLVRLETRRECFSQIFLHKMIHNTITCEDLLSKLKFRVPALCSRDRSTFYLLPYRTDVFKYSPINTMCIKYNNVGNDFDIFTCNRDSIRSHFYL